MNRLLSLGASVFVLIGLLAPTHAQILPPGAVATRLNTTINYQFTEGPVWDGVGAVYFSDTNNGNPASYSAIIKYDVATGVFTTAAGDNTGGANGLYLEGPGVMLSADQIAKRVVRRSLSSVGTVEVISAGITTGPDRNGAITTTPFAGPNDLVTDSTGGIYFTDPNWQSPGATPGFYYIAADGAITQRLYGSTNDKPNGIILSPDESTLYVGNWQTNSITAWDVDGPGQLSNSRTFVSGTSVVPRPDGLTVDKFGNVYAAISTGVRAWDPAGQELFSLAVPSGATNLEIGGPDGQTLYITNGSGGGLYSVGLNLVPEPAVMMLLAAAAPVIALRRRR